MRGKALINIGVNPAFLSRFLMRKIPLRTRCAKVPFWFASSQMFERFMERRTQILKMIFWKNLKKKKAGNGRRTCFCREVIHLSDPAVELVWFTRACPNGFEQLTIHNFCTDCLSFIFVFENDTRHQLWSCCSSWYHRGTPRGDLRVRSIFGSLRKGSWTFC